MIKYLKQLLWPEEGGVAIHAYVPKAGIMHVTVEGLMYVAGMPEDVARSYLDKHGANLGYNIWYEVKINAITLR